MSQIHAILQKMGLTDTEATIYMTGLGYDAVGVKELEKATRVKRTTIYHALDTLIQKGLASKKESGTGAKLLFMMTPPENIKKFLDREIKLLEERKTEIDTILPLLINRTRQNDEPFKVSHFEGIEGIKLVVEEALYCRGHEWRIIAPRNNFFRQFDNAYASYYMKTRKANGIFTRSLWEYDPKARLLSKQEIIERNPRYLPEVMYGQFQSVIITFDDKVAFISSMKNLSAVLIQSPEIQKTMAALFDGLWSVSKKREQIESQG